MLKPPGDSAGHVDAAQFAEFNTQLFFDNNIPPDVFTPVPNGE